MKSAARILFVLATGLAGLALAQDRPAPQSPGQPPAAGYQGVVPGTGHAPPRAPSAGPGGALLLTWPGFQQRPDGASRFFLQTTGPVQVEQRTEEGRFVLVLKNTGIHLRNNRRRLETRYFNTPVSVAQVERRGRDVAFVLDLRAPVTPVVSQEQAPNGYNFVFLELPAGSYLPEELQTERGQPGAAGRAPSRDTAAGAPEGGSTEIRVY